MKNAASLYAIVCYVLVALGCRSQSGSSQPHSTALQKQPSNELFIGKTFFEGDELQDFQFIRGASLQPDSFSYSVYQQNGTQEYIFSLEKRIREDDVKQYRITDTVHLSSVADPAQIQIEEQQNRLILRLSGTVRKRWTFDQQPTATSTRWQGTYNASIEYGPMEEGIYASIDYSIYVGPDSCTFSGIGYRTYFTDMCRADTKSNELKLYFVKVLDGDGFSDHSNQSLLGTLFIRDGSYFFKSPWVADSSWNYHVAIPVKQE